MSSDDLYAICEFFSILTHQKSSFEVYFVNIQKIFIFFFTELTFFI